MVSCNVFSCLCSPLSSVSCIIVNTFRFSNFHTFLISLFIRQSCGEGDTECILFKKYDQWFSLLSLPIYQRAYSPNFSRYCLACEKNRGFLGFYHTKRLPESTADSRSASLKLSRVLRFQVWPTANMRFTLK